MELNKDTVKNVAKVARLNLTDKEVKNTIKLFKNAGVSFASIATGVRFSSADQKERSRNVEEAKEYIKLADQLGAKVIRLVPFSPEQLE